MSEKGRGGNSRRLRFESEEQAATSDKGNPTKPDGFVGRGRATERPDFGPTWPEVEQRSPRGRGPKSKPGPKGRKQLEQAPADIKTPPLSERPDASPPVEGTPPTSGQVGPKSKPGGKLKQDSEQARPSDRLRHEEEPPPADDINVYLKRDKTDHIKRDICYHK